MTHDKFWYKFVAMADRRNLSADNQSANNYMFQVNSRNIRKKCDICSKLTIKIPERRQWLHSGVFTVNFEHVSIVDFEKVDVCRHSLGEFL